MAKRSNGMAPAALTPGNLARILSCKNQRVKDRKDGLATYWTTVIPRWHDAERLICPRCMREIVPGERYARTGRKSSKGYGRKYYHAACWEAMSS